MNEAYSTFYGNAIPFPKIINVVYVAPILYILVILSLFSNSILLQKGSGAFKVLSGIFPLLLLLFSFTGLHHFTVSWGLYLMMPAAVYLLISGFKKKSEAFVADDNASEIFVEQNAVDLNDEFISEQKQNRRRKQVLIFAVAAFLILTFFGIYYFSRPNPNATTNEPVTFNQNDANQSNQDTAMQSNVQNNQPAPAPVTNTQPASNSSQQQQSNSENNNAPTDNAGAQQSEDDETYIVQDEESYFYNEPNYDYKRRGHVLTGDTVIIKKISDDGLWGYAKYTSSTGLTTEGWLLMNTLQKLSQ